MTHQNTILIANQNQAEEYSFEHAYTDNEKRRISAELVRWLNVQTCSVPNPGTKEAICPLHLCTYNGILEEGNFFSHAQLSTRMAFGKQ
jgi:hypothetical protein